MRRYRVPLCLFVLASVLFLSGCAWLQDWFALDPTAEEGEYVLALHQFGEGKVTIIPAGIPLAKGYYSFPADTIVTLTATPASGWEFRSWSGEGVVFVAFEENVATVVMTANRTVFVTFGREKTVLHDHVRLLSDDTMTHLLREVGGIFEFSLQAIEVRTLQPGNVMVNASYGVLHRVMEVSVEGSVIRVVTAKATLEDVVQEGTISFTKRLNPADLQPGGFLTPGVELLTIDPRALEFSYSIDIAIGPVEVTGQANLDFEIDFAVDFSWRGMQRLRVVFVVDADQNLSLKADHGAKMYRTVLIANKTFFLIKVAPFVFITPEISLYAGVRGSFMRDRLRVTEFFGC